MCLNLTVKEEVPGVNVFWRQTPGTGEAVGSWAHSLKVSKGQSQAEGVDTDFTYTARIK